MRGISVTAISRLKHTDLHRAAKAMGGQQALAQHLGVHPVTLGQWCNLRACPPVSAENIPIHRRSGWTAERVRDLEEKLFALTGKTLDELFPVELRLARDFLDEPKVRERTAEVPFSRLVEFRDSQQERLTLPSPVDEAESRELRQALDSLLGTLPSRSREIIQMRWGLKDGHTYTLEEIGKAYKLSKERVRQIEAAVIRRLKHPAYRNQLVGFLDQDRPV